MLFPSAVARSLHMPHFRILWLSISCVSLLCYFLCSCVSYALFIFHCASFLCWACLLTFGARAPVDLPMLPFSFFHFLCGCYPPSWPTASACYSFAPYFPCFRVFHTYFTPLCAMFSCSHSRTCESLCGPLLSSLFFFF